MKYYTYNLILNLQLSSLMYNSMCIVIYKCYIQYAFILILLFITFSLIALVTTCPVLSTPDNGQISCSPGNDSPGDTCTLTCDDGFEISGTESRTCQDDGTWNGADDTLCLGWLYN